MRITKEDLKFFETKEELQNYSEAREIKVRGYVSLDSYLVVKGSSSDDDFAVPVSKDGKIISENPYFGERLKLLLENLARRRAEV